MKDYRIEIRVKNGLLWSAMQECGYRTAAELHRASGLAQTVIGEFLNLKRAPYLSSGDLSVHTERLCETLGRGVEELFPSEVLFDGVKTNLVERWASSQDVLSIFQDQKSPEQLVSESDTRDLVAKVMSEKLTTRERRVIELRFGMDGDGMRTLQEIADVFDVTRGRVMQIESKAMRKLRHDKNSSPLLIESEG